MKKNMILVEAIDADGRPCVGDALDLDDRSFRAFVLNVLWNAQAVAGVDPAALEGGDIPLRLRPDARAVMSMEEYVAQTNEMIRQAEEAKKAAEAGEEPPKETA